MVPEGEYLTAGNLGLIAEDDVSMARTAQMSLMGAVYAQGTIEVSKQTSIGGALVSNYFDMGNNVPAIFHVPDLPENLPPGMPGGPGSFEAFSRDIAIVDWYQDR